MSEHIKNINPWAEKLGQISVPNIDASWQEMHAVLDLQMPDKKNKKRKFFFWIIFLSSLATIYFFAEMIYFKKPPEQENMISENRTVRAKKENDSKKDHSPSDSDEINNRNKTRNTGQPDKTLSDRKIIAAEKKTGNKDIISKNNDSANELAHDLAHRENRF
ncbi:MAG TPA: hypothetical protein VKR53_10650, partial [Puia sp.]|nr:hypothetical protein [Puia sp.]